LVKRRGLKHVALNLFATSLVLLVLGFMLINAQETSGGSTGELEPTAHSINVTAMVGVISAVSGLVTAVAGLVTALVAWRSLPPRTPPVAPTSGSSSPEPIEPTSPGAVSGPSEADQR
jgi:hypothetical protein